MNKGKEKIQCSFHTVMQRRNRFRFRIQDRHAVDCSCVACQTVVLWFEIMNGIVPVDHFPIEVDGAC